MGIILNTLESTMKYRNRQVMKKLGVGGYSGQNQYYRLFGNKIKKPLPIVFLSKAMAVAELAVLVPANIGVKGTKKVNTQIQKNKPKVSKGTKKKLFNKLLSASIFAGELYVKKATGYSDAKRGAKLAVTGAKVGRRISYFAMPIIGSGISLFGNVTKNIARSIQKNTQKKQMNASGKHTPNDENYIPSRSEYKKMKKQHPDLTPDELLQNQPIQDEEQPVQSVEEEPIQAVEEDYTEEPENITRTGRTATDSKIENVSTNPMQEVIDNLEGNNEIELTPEELVELEKSKMINPNIYVEHLNTEIIDNILDDFDSIYTGENNQSKEAMEILEQIKNR